MDVFQISSLQNSLGEETKKVNKLLSALKQLKESNKSTFEHVNSVDIFDTFTEWTQKSKQELDSAIARAEEAEKQVISTSLMIDDIVFELYLGSAFDAIFRNDRIVSGYYID